MTLFWSFSHQTIIPHRVAINCCVTPTWPFRAAQCSAVRPKLAVGRLWNSKIGDFRSFLFVGKAMGKLWFDGFGVHGVHESVLVFLLWDLHAHQFRNLFNKNAVKQVWGCWFWFLLRKMHYQQIIVWDVFLVTFLYLVVVGLHDLLSCNFLCRTLLQLWQLHQVLSMRTQEGKVVELYQLGPAETPFHSGQCRLIGFS